MPAHAAARAYDLSTIDAGEFSAWLAGARAVLRGGTGTDVPCGGCQGCCTSSYHVALRAGDRAARARVPERFLLPAPARGEVLAYIGYDAAGRCPLLAEQGCRIYADRPQTCRDYDCRVFAAADLRAGDGRRSAIDERVSAWRFSYDGEESRAAHEAVRAAARFVIAHAALFPVGWAPTSPMGTAAVALKTYRVFMGSAAECDDASLLAHAVYEAARAFDQRRAPDAAGAGAT